MNSLCFITGEIEDRTSCFWKLLGRCSMGSTEKKKKSRDVGVRKPAFPTRLRYFLILWPWYEILADRNLFITSLNDHLLSTDNTGLTRRRPMEHPAKQVKATQRWSE
ncbi:uncharacterized protein LOC144322531 [Canis aureus]